MFQGGHLTASEVKMAISQAARLRSFEIVHFVGGDPLLHPDILLEAIAHANSLKLQCGITTSAFWAKSPAAALAVLDELQRAGLTEITISYDDAHAEFVRLSFIKHAVQAALALDLRLRVAVVVESQARITATSLRTELGLDDEGQVKVYQTLVNSTGRAAGSDKRGERARHADAYRGPCQSILQTFQVDHEGGIRPCCGVLPHHDGLRVGNIHRGGLGAAVEAASADTLFKWIGLAGPVSILAEVTKNDLHPVLPEEFDGICTACDYIFRSPPTLARIRAAAAAHRDLFAMWESMVEKGNSESTASAVSP